MDIEDIVKESHSLISRVVHDAYEHHKNEEWDLYSAYIYRPGRHIYELSEEYCSIEINNQFHSAPIVLRTMLEGTFSIAAAANDRIFAGNQIQREVEEFLKYFNSAKEVPEDLISDSHSLLKRIEAEFNVSNSRYYKVKEVAKKAEMKELYSSHYSWLCTSTHPTVQGIITSESGGTLGKRIETYCMAIIITAGHLARTIRTSCPQEYVDKSAGLIDELIALKNEGVFNALDAEEVQLKKVLTDEYERGVD